MKKTLILVLCLMIIGLVGCGSKTEEVTTTKSPITTSIITKPPTTLLTTITPTTSKIITTTKGKTLDATYILKTAILNGKDIKSEFSIFSIIIKPDNTMDVSIFRDGFLTKRISTYTISGSKLIETYNNETYEYSIYKNMLLTSMEDFEGTIEITLEVKSEDVMENTVDFKSVLFGEDLNLTKIYNYCPAIIQDKDENGRDIMYIWYCTNKDSGVIVDHIGFRVGTKEDNGKWSFTDEEIALAPTPNTWDARHVCDPSVVKGEFNYKGETYNYLMAYLGCTSEDYQKNETGIAISKSPYGPWVKVNEVNPIVPWYDDGDYDTEQAIYESRQGTSSIYWGTGMPSLLTVDKKGEIIMLYSSTHRGIGIRRIDLSNVESPVLKFVSSIQHTGAYNSQNSKCNVSIPDFAYDSVNKRLYVVSVTNERNPKDITLTRVNSHSYLAYIDNLNNMEEVSNALKNGGYTWNVVGYVGPNETGWERNHNPGIVKNSYSEIPDSTLIKMIVSTGHNSWPTENIFTYRLFGWEFEITQ